MNIVNEALVVGEDDATSGVANHIHTREGLREVADAQVHCMILHAFDASRSLWQRNVDNTDTMASFQKVPDDRCPNEAAATRDTHAEWLLRHGCSDSHRYIYIFVHEHRQFS